MKIIFCILEPAGQPKRVGKRERGQLSPSYLQKILAIFYQGAIVYLSQIAKCICLKLPKCICLNWIVTELPRWHHAVDHILHSIVTFQKIYFRRKSWQIEWIKSIMNIFKGIRKLKVMKHQIFALKLVWIFASKFASASVGRRMSLLTRSKIFSMSSPSLPGTGCQGLSRRISINYYVEYALSKSSPAARHKKSIPIVTMFNLQFQMWHFIHPPRFLLYWKTTTATSTSTSYTATSTLATAQCTPSGFALSPC